MGFQLIVVQLCKLPAVIRVRTTAAGANKYKVGTTQLQNPPMDIATTTADAVVGAHWQGALQRAAWKYTPSQSSVNQVLQSLLLLHVACCSKEQARTMGEK